jgi:hypothetical protein
VASKGGRIVWVGKFRAFNHSLPSKFKLFIKTIIGGEEVKVVPRSCEVLNPEPVLEVHKASSPFEDLCPESSVDV